MAWNVEMTTDRVRLKLPGHALLCAAMLCSVVVASLSDEWSSDTLEDYEDVDDMDTGQLTPVVAVVGSDALLPCHVDKRAAYVVRANMRLLLWYKDGHGAPFFSYDMRKRLGREGHRSVHESLGARSSLRTTDAGPMLIVAPVAKNDAGIFRCRVDFKNSPTLNAHVNLSVIVPPTSVTIEDSTGRRLESVLGPLTEGAPVTVTCHAQGDPAPNITWWRQDRLLDSTWTSRLGMSTNQLQIASVLRSDLNAKLECRATNTQESQAVTSVVQIELHLAPLSVQIVSHRNQPLSASKATDIQCVATGSRPSAVIKWSKNGFRVTTATTEVVDSNVTRSTYHVVPTVEDTGSTIACHAYNPFLPDEILSDSMVVSVNYAPLVKLRAGRSVHLANIEEGDDLYFECDISARPWVFSIEWRHNDAILRPNTSAGVIVSNQSLALQDVTRHSAGVYHCLATNSEGRTVSNGVSLRVKYAPQCVSDQIRVEAATRHELLNISCRVQALPDTDLQFDWTYNSTGDVQRLSSSQFSVNGSTSVLYYTVRSDLDYGTLQCSASSSVGRQRRPCIVIVTPAGAPEPPRDCRLSNGSAEKGNELRRQTDEIEESVQGQVTLRCASPGSDGGLQQHFRLVVLGPDGSVRHNSTGDQPEFSVDRLKAETYYQFILYAVNMKGESKPLILSMETTRDKAERRLERVIDGNLEDSLGILLTTTPTLMAVVAVVCSLVLLSILLALVVRRFRRSAPSSPSTLSAVASCEQLACKATAGRGDASEALTSLACVDHNPNMIGIHGSSKDGQHSSLSPIQLPSMRTGDAGCTCVTPALNNVSKCRTQTLDRRRTGRRRPSGSMQEANVHVPQDHPPPLSRTNVELCGHSCLWHDDEIVSTSSTSACAFSGHAVSLNRSSTAPQHTSQHDGQLPTPPPPPTCREKGLRPIESDSLAAGMGACGTFGRSARSFQHRTQCDLPNNYSTMH